DSDVAPVAKHVELDGALIRVRNARRVAGDRRVRGDDVSVRRRDLGAGVGCPDLEQVTSGRARAIAQSVVGELTPVRRRLRRPRTLPGELTPGLEVVGQEQRAAVMPRRELAEHHLANVHPRCATICSYGVSSSRTAAVAAGCGSACSTHATSGSPYF